MELKVICKHLLVNELDGSITEGEYGADIVGITVPRMYDEHDLSEFSFRITAVSKTNESVAEQVLVMDSFDDEKIHLVWTVTSDFTASSGEVTLILAGISADNSVQVKFLSQPVIINDDARFDFFESPAILEQAYNQVQLEVQKALDAAERAEEAASKPVIIESATEEKIGGIKSGNDISVAEDGMVTVNSVNGKKVEKDVPEDAVFTDTVYELPVASKSELGGVKVDEKTININSNGVISITESAGGSGETVTANCCTFANASEYPLLCLSVYGKSTQNGVPTPEEPAPIVSVGDDGGLVITTDNGGTIKLSAEITSGLPLCSAGDVRDELIHNIDGTGKIIKRTGVVTFDGSDDESWYLSSNYSRIVTGVCSGTAISAKSTYDVVASLCNRLTPVAAVDTWLGEQGISFETEDAKGHIHICISSLVGNSDLTAWTWWLASNPLTVVYQLAEPQEIELSAAEMSALRTLQSYSGVTNVYNDEGAEMSVKVCTNTMLSEYVYPIIKGQQKRIEELEAAVLSLGGND